MVGKEPQARPYSTKSPSPVTRRECQFCLDCVVLYSHGERCGDKDPRKTSERATRCFEVAREQ